MTGPELNVEAMSPASLRGDIECFDQTLINIAFRSGFWIGWSHHGRKDPHLLRIANKEYGSNSLVPELPVRFGGELRGNRLALFSDVHCRYAIKGEDSR